MTRGEMFAITAALLWGVNYPLVKIVLTVVPELDFLLIRFSLTALLFIAYLAYKGESFTVARAHFGSVLALGLLGVGVYNIVWTYGIHRTTAANAALLISASPVFTGLYSLLRGQEQWRWRKGAGVLAALAGIGLILAGTPGARFSLDSELFVGNLLMLAGSLLFSYYAVVAKPLLLYYSPTKLTGLAMLAGLPVLVAAGLIEGRWPPPLYYQPLIWLGFAYIVIAGTIIAFIFWYKGIARTSPFRTVIFHYLVPVVSMIAGALLLDEALTFLKIVGGLLVLTGLIAVKWEGAGAGLTRSDRQVNQ